MMIITAFTDTNLIYMETENINQYGRRADKIGYKLQKGSFKVSVMIIGISKIVHYDVRIRKVHNNLLDDDKKLACF